MTPEAQEFKNQLFLEMSLHILGEIYQSKRLDGLRGQIMHQRTMMILKPCLLPEVNGVHLLDNPKVRQIIKDEADRAPRVFFDKMRLEYWLNMRDGRFYQTKSDWSNRIISTNFIPNFSFVSELEVRGEFGLSHSGGTHRRSEDTYVIRESERRRQSVVEWGIKNYKKASYAKFLETEETKLNAAKLFCKLIYNILMSTSIPDNREDSKWALIEHSMIDWLDFGRDIRHSNINTLWDSELFYDERNLYAYNPETRIIELRSELVRPQDFSHYDNRNVLGLIQSHNSHDAGLSTLVIYTPGVGVHVPADFDSNRFEYSYEVPSRATQSIFTALPISDYAAVHFETTVQLELGENEFLIRVESQDRLLVNIYRITIIRG